MAFTFSLCFTLIKMLTLFTSLFVSFAAAVPRAICPNQIIEAGQSNISLTAYLDPPVDLSAYTVVWKRDDLNKDGVHAYREDRQNDTTRNDSSPTRPPDDRDAANMEAVRNIVIPVVVVVVVGGLIVFLVKSGKIRENRPTNQLIEAEVHDNVTLQCDLDSRVNIEKCTIVCERVDFNKKVHAYRGKQDHPHDQMDQYRGRTTLNREDLSRGVLTLLISSVQTSDSGPYRCFVPKTRKSSCTFNLTVDGAHMKAVRAGIITTAVIALCVLVVVLVVKRRTIQDCLKRLRVKKRTSNGSEERDEDQERPLKTVV
ncbi:Butyrophilin subfamily 2 member A1 [Nibea albiflora]|nr:Butyrophilin subfamily 2 member A1 [Nibea albiflora]